LPSATVSVTGNVNGAALWRVCAIAFSIAASSLPSTGTMPLTTTCGVKTARSPRVSA
jgi:hypothetical protein